MKTIIVTPPTTEPVTLSEAKAQLRIDDSFTLDDDYIEALISSARERCENYCNQFFTEQSIDMVFDEQIEYELYLPYPNLNITKVSYVNSDGVTETIDDSSYFVNENTQQLIFSEAIDSTNLRVSATTSAPASMFGVEMAIKMIVTDLYELRTETAVGVSLSNNPAVVSLLYPSRLELGV